MSPRMPSNSKSSLSKSKSIDGLSRSMARMHIQLEQAATKARRSTSGSAQMRRIASGEGLPLSAIGQQQNLRMAVTRHLSRPVYCRATGVTSMTWDGRQLLASLAHSTNMKVLPPSLAEALDNMTTYVPPTHVLAIRSSDARQSLQLYPVHDHVLRAQCTRLGSVLDACKAAAGKENMPMVPITMPTPQLFSSLLAFLYTRNDTMLLTAVFPELTNPEFISDCQTALSFDENVDLSYTLKGIVDRMSRAHLRRETLVRFTVRAVSLHKVACHLGVCDDLFWRTLEAMWHVIVTAMSRPA
ncbi:hypothetical protein FISHEDRAFT_62497 [Fistulina hepatica ATCC 64428]|nr:hypothetical protein FISHEDRAFT_62497 [Fistulina hepatica ATCC 64428]